MRVYLLSPSSVPMNPCLFPCFKPYWEKMGCVFVDRINECEVVFFDLHVRLSDYSQNDIDWIISRKIPCAIFDEWDRGNMSNDIYPLPLTEQQKQIFNLIDNNEINNVHFCRLMDKTQTYSYNIYPYEKPISYEEPLLTEEELFNREYDVVFIANQSPSRDRIAKALRNDIRLNCFISIGADKLPFEEFLRIHKLGKLFVASGAGGFSDERKQCLFSIAGLIQEQTDQLLLHPFSHLENCLKIRSSPIKENLNTIFEVVNNKEKLYQIYTNVVNHVKKFYSEEYISRYILQTIMNNLWVK